MKIEKDRIRYATRGALWSVLFLSGGMVIGLLAGFAVSGLPLHVPETTKSVLASIPALSALFGGGFLWGRAIGRVTGSPYIGRMGLAGALSFGPGVLIAGISLAVLEGALVQRGLIKSLPIHWIFTLLFVPASFLVAALGGFALGVSQKSLALALKLAAVCGLSGSAGFLLVNRLMDAFGWRVGAPGAEARATMLVVMMVSSLAAAAAGGAGASLMLSRAVRQAGDLLVGEPETVAGPVSAG